MLILMIALGGAFGAVARYGLSGWVQSFLLGLSLPFFASLAWSVELRTLVTIGLQARG